MALGTAKGMHHHQMDVTTAFLYAPLEEEVYMEQPEGTVLPGNENKVMRLIKCHRGGEHKGSPCNIWSAPSSPCARPVPYQSWLFNFKVLQMIFVPDGLIIL